MHRALNWLHGVGLAFVLLWSPLLDTKTTHASEVETRCDIHLGPCRGMIGDIEVILEITPRPVKAMRELHFKVVIRGRNLSAPPFIDLDMPGMHMGPNLVRLKASEPETYEGRGVIVRCMSGRTDWRASVCLPGIGKAHFYFNVVHE